MLRIRSNLRHSTRHRLTPCQTQSAALPPSGHSPFHAAALQSGNDSARRPLACCARGAENDGHSDDAEDSVSKEELQERLRNSRLYSSHDPRDIGGEYGQGFISFSNRGEPDRLGVDELNERLAVKGRLRLRHSMKPDEGYGAIFFFDGVICNTQAIKQQAWREVAQRRGFNFPSIERPQMYTMSAERAAMDMLHWTRDMKEARDIAYEVADNYARLFKGLQQPVEGLKSWLDAIAAAKVPCAVVSSLDRFMLQQMLEQFGISHSFTCTVTAEDGMEARSQQLLSAAIKLGRPPNQCIAFVSDIQGITAAHNCSIKAVAVTGVHAGYQLRTADLTCGNLGELTVYNLRRLFANVGNELMDLRKATSDDKPRRRKALGVGMLDPP